MSRRLLFLFLLAVLMTSTWAAATPPAPKDLDLTANDGLKLKATYFAAGKAGPGILLLHQCNRDRKMWNDLALKLAAEGINVLTLDFRGFGESGGPRANEIAPQEAQRIVTQLWPGDVDKAYDYLRSQAGVKKDIIGAAGASCGVNQSIQLARRHPEVKSLVLLSGFTDRDGRSFLKQAKGLPLFGSAADDDAGAVEQMEWLLSLSPNPANTFQHYQTGGHGIEMFAPHQDLTGLIVNWFNTTLIKTPGRAPENRNASFRGDTNVLAKIDEPGGADKIAEQLQKNPKSVTFSEALVNQLGYEHIQFGDTKGAIAIFKLNVAANPNSANAYDSLGDGYAADGQTDLAVRNAKTALSMLANDKSLNDQRRDAIKQSAQQKLDQMGTAAAQ